VRIAERANVAGVEAVELPDFLGPLVDGSHATKVNNIVDFVNYL
jgi:hypothetical protein